MYIESLRLNWFITSKIEGPLETKVLKIECLKNVELLKKIECLNS